MEAAEANFVRSLAQSAAARQEKETVVKVPLMPLSAAVDQTILLPKENWLAAFCRAEKSHRRRTLVYVRKTGTRNIQDRIETVLRKAGLRAITLYGSVSPRKREAWIEKNDDADVFISNPRLVQTGLDLVSFSSVVYYEIEYSLYTLWQACPEIGAPGYDAFTSDGANFNLIIGNGAIDTVSSSVPHRAYLCQVHPID